MNNESLIEHIKETAALMHQVSMQSHGIEQTQAQEDKVDGDGSKPDDKTFEKASSRPDGEV